MKSGVRLPKTLEKYRDDFDDVLRVFDLSDGFVLLPIALPGPDLAHGLAHFLLKEGHPPIIVAPEAEDDWKNLASSLLSVKPEQGGLVMVIAGSDIPADLSLPLRIVNERRDAIAKQLNCPLLWCGSPDFLVQTGQMAPDFWSIRAVERRMEGRAKPESKPTAKESMPEQTDLLDEAVRQGDRKSSEVLFLARLRKIMTDGSQEEFADAIANIPKLLENADSTFTFELTLMKAEMARRRGNIANAIELLDELEEKAKTPEEECRIDLLRGRVWERAGDFERALKAYERAEDTPKLKNHVWEELAHLYHMIHLSRSSSLLHRISLGPVISKHENKGTDRPLHALRCVFHAESLVYQHDEKRARRILREAIELHEASKDEPTILFGGEVAEAIERARAVIAAATEASKTASNKSLPTSLPPYPVPKPTIPLIDRPWFTRVIVASMILCLAGLVTISVGVFSGMTSRDKIHCFQGPNENVTCGESLEHCEKLRAIAGPSITKPCQKPLFAPSTH